MNNFRFVDETHARRGFDRIAPAYASGAEVEREIGRRLLERLDYVRLAPARVVDLGCANAWAGAELQKRYPEAAVIGVDFSEAQLRAGGPARSSRWWRRLGKANRLQKICANATWLPLVDNSVGLIWSNLMLPWCDDVSTVFAEARRVLVEGGLLTFTTVGPDTLKELKAAYRDGGTHVLRFADMHDLGDLLMQAGFAEPVMDMELLTLEYADTSRLFEDLRRSGPGNPMVDRPRGLCGRRRWHELNRRLDATRRAGKLPMTLEVVYGHAWKGAPRKTAGAPQKVSAADRPAVVTVWPRRRPPGASEGA